MIIMKETRCVICGARKNGLEVRQDFVIETIRWFKRNITRNEKGYRLVVCKECYPKYAKERSKFERRQIFYLIIGVLFTIVIVIGAGNKALALLYGFVVLVFVYLLSLLTYIPAVNTPGKAMANPR